MKKIFLVLVLAVAFVIPAFGTAEQTATAVAQITQTAIALKTAGVYAQQTATMVVQETQTAVAAGKTEVVLSFSPTNTPVNTATYTITPTITPTYTMTITPTVVFSIDKYGDTTVDVTVNTFSNFASHEVRINSTPVSFAPIIKAGKITNIALQFGTNVIQYVAHLFSKGTSGTQYTTAATSQTIYSLGTKVSDIKKLTSQLAMVNLMDYSTQSITINAAASGVTQYAEDMVITKVGGSVITASTLELWTGGTRIGGGTKIGTVSTAANSAFDFTPQFVDGFIYIPALTPVKISVTAGSNDTKTLYFIGAKVSDIAKIK